MKKVLSVLLAIVMIFTITVPALAAPKAVSASENYDGNPVIIVRGIDFAGLTYENGEKALNVSAGTIFSATLEKSKLFSLSITLNIKAYMVWILLVHFLVFLKT